MYVAPAEFGATTVATHALLLRLPGQYTRQNTDFR